MPTRSTRLKWSGPTLSIDLSSVSRWRATDQNNADSAGNAGSGLETAPSVLCPPFPASVNQRPLFIFRLSRQTADACWWRQEGVANTFTPRLQIQFPTLSTLPAMTAFPAFPALLVDCLPNAFPANSWVFEPLDPSTKKFSYEQDDPPLNGPLRLWLRSCNRGSATRWWRRRQPTSTAPSSPF